MRICTLAVISMLATGLPALAEAADIPVGAPATGDPVGISPSDRDWSGIYLGVLLGYSFGESDLEPGPNVDTDGFDGGVYAGYNYQFNNWVTGVEADMVLSDVEGAGAGTKVKQDWSASIRVRAGYSLESFLLYGTGGLAASGNELSGGGSKDSETLLGWTVGAGIESMITDNVTARVEYRYSGYEDKVFSLGAPTGSDLTTSTVRAGVGVKF